MHGQKSTKWKNIQTQKLLTQSSTENQAILGYSLLY